MNTIGNGSSNRNQFYSQGYLYHEIEQGAEFYVDEEDYLKQEGKASRNKPMKTEATSASLPSNARTRQESSPTSRRKRPRRNATNHSSYVVPDSDDDIIAGEEDVYKRPRMVESNMQKWIFHLSELLKEEQRKVSCFVSNPEHSFSHHLATVQRPEETG